MYEEPVSTINCLDMVFNGILPNYALLNYKVQYLVLTKLCHMIGVPATTFSSLS